MLTYKMRTWKLKNKPRVGIKPKIILVTLRDAGEEEVHATRTVGLANLQSPPSSGNLCERGFCLEVTFAWKSNAGRLSHIHCQNPHQLSSSGCGLGVLPDSSLQPHTLPVSGASPVWKQAGEVHPDHLCIAPSECHRPKGRNSASAPPLAQVLNPVGSQWVVAE